MALLHGCSLRKSTVSRTVLNVTKCNMSNLNKILRSHQVKKHKDFIESKEKTEGQQKQTLEFALKQEKIPKGCKNKSHNELQINILKIKLIT